MSDIRTVIVEQPAVPTERFLFEGIDTSRKPHFTVSEVARFFFGRTGYWVRWLENKGFLVVGTDNDCAHTRPIKVPRDADGKEIKDLDSYEGEITWADGTTSTVVDGRCTLCGGTQVAASRTEKGARYYTLSDVEQMAHALAEKDAISGAQLASVIQLLAVEARVWGYM